MSTKKFTTRHGIDANYQDIVAANNVSTNTLSALVSTGTAPLSISSTTKVDNLNVDLLDSYHASISNTANTIVVRDANTFISLNGIYMNSSEGMKRIAWNDTYSTYDMQLLDGVTLQVGQESHVYGRATENIQNGQVVMFAGAQGDGLLLRVANTQISGFEPKWIVGIATQTIPENEWGYVTWFGKVSDLNTFNYSLGDILYVDNSVAGGLSNTKPTAPNYNITMAAVVRVASSAEANNGILMVRPDFGESLGELHDVELVGVSNNDVLIYSSANTRWENKTQAEITSGDSDKLDGQHGSYYTGYTDTSNTNNLIYTNNAISSNVTLIQGVDVTQNNRITVIEGVDATQNTNISNLTTWLSSNNSLQSGINTTQNTYIQAAFDSSNTKFSSSGGTVSGDIVVTGNVTVQGTTTTLNVDTLVVEDKNITLANVASPTDVTADGAGLTILGTTNKTWNWVNLSSSWTSSENIDLASGKSYKINGIDILTSTTISNIENVDNTQNTNISNLTTWLSSNNTSQAGINTTQNTSISIIQGVDNTQNTNITLLQGVNTTQNTNISSAFSKANSAITLGTTPLYLGSTNTSVSGLISISSNTLTLIGNTSSTNTTTGTLIITGGVGISGALNATTKSFDIVHPSDPEKRLRYGSLESPSHSVRLTGKGSVYKKTGIIRLPEYFKDLVHKEEINIQITNIRHGEILWVEEERIEENYFIVGCNSEEDLEFYWSLTAERTDVEKLVVEY